MKQNQQANEEPPKSDSKRQEQVFSHTLDSPSEGEPLRITRPNPQIQANTNDFKVEILKFEGKLDPEEFLDWLHTVVRVFECKDIPEVKKVKLVALRLCKYAALWWTNLCAKRPLRDIPQTSLIHLRFQHEFQYKLEFGGEV